MKKLATILTPICLLSLFACEAVEPPTAWYEDSDGDDYGHFNGTVTFSTNKPLGYVANNDDCNDADAGINPAATEDNSNPADLNCNGEIGEAPFAVGDYGPAGGIVFQTDGTNGLEAAPEDQDDGTGAEWGCYGTDITGADSLTDGAQNTLDMLAAACSPYTGGNSLAVDLVTAYSLNGYDDWYLPAKDELNALYAQKDTVGGFASNNYWSSSEDGTNYAWVQHFLVGSQNTNVKSNLFRVRAVRAF